MANGYGMPKKPELTEEDEALRREFGDRLRKLREALGLRPLEFAAFGGISMAHQYRIEAGERDAESLYLQRLARAFGGLAIGALFSNGAAVQAQEQKPATQVFNAPVKGGVAGRDIINKGRK